MSKCLKNSIAALNGDQSLLNARKDAIESFHGVKLEFVDGQWSLATPPKRAVRIGGSLNGLVITGDSNILLGPQ